MADFNASEDANQGEYSGTQSSSNESGSSQPIESAFPDEDEDTVTMMDVAAREDKLEEEASAVLGNSDEKNCTYPKGYVSRQALYSCSTCFDSSGEVAAICLACSLECHDNHELYELYTKRNYRCDCGNSKFKPGFECKLTDKQTKKPPLNEHNKYNHNFSGKYCICNKRYPPDEADTSQEAQDEMLQCIVCEDWYHSKHLGTEKPPTKFEELICGGCVENLDFIRYYSSLESAADQDCHSTEPDELDSTAQPKLKTSAVSTKHCSEDQVVEASQTSESDRLGLDEKNATSPNDSKIENEVETRSSSTVCESDTNDSQVENKDPGHPKMENPECALEKFKSMAKLSSRDEPDSKTAQRPSGPIFWSSCSWRSKLCRCQACKDMYKAKECEYLLDYQDTVQYYEAQGKAIAKNSASPIERGMTALNQMNRAAVVEALHGYEELRADLSTYLRKFADAKKVVREEDIREFFDQLKSKKRPRFE